VLLNELRNTLPVFEEILHEDFKIPYVFQRSISFYALLRIVFF